MRRTVRYSLDEWQTTTKLADASGLTISEWIRHRSMTAGAETPPGKETKTNAKRSK